MADQPPTPDKPDSSALCLTCGMCCNGAVHPNVYVLPEDVPLVTTLGLSVQPLDNGRIGFLQPCALYREHRCSAYPNHPPTCQDYRCALLKKYEQGKVTLAEAQAIVEDVKKLMEGDAAYPRPLQVFSWDERERELARRWNDEQGLLDTDEGHAANAEAVMQSVTLDVLLQRHFGRSRDRD